MTSIQQPCARSLRSFFAERFDSDQGEAAVGFARFIREVVKPIEGFLQGLFTPGGWVEFDTALGGPKLPAFLQDRNTATHRKRSTQMEHRWMRTFNTYQDLDATAKLVSNSVAHTDKVSFREANHALVAMHEVPESRLAQQLH